MFERETQSSGGPGGGAAARVDPGQAAKGLEARVHMLLEESASAAAAGDASLALERAKEAGRRERELVRLLDDSDRGEDTNLDLTFAVCVNLGLAYEGAGMHREAAHAYGLVVRNTVYPASWRLRVNIGNLHARLGDCGAALKHYRMALDQVPPTNPSLRVRINCNIGAALIGAGRYLDAASALEAAAAEHASALHATRQSGGDGDAGHAEEDSRSSEVFLCGKEVVAAAFNLVVCYHALGDPFQMMAAFQRLISFPVPCPDDPDTPGFALPTASRVETPHDDETSLQADTDAPAPLSLSLHRYDALSAEQRDRTRYAQGLMVAAARVIAPHLAPALQQQQAGTAGQSRAALVNQLLSGGPALPAASALAMGHLNSHVATKAAAAAPRSKPPPPWDAGYEWAVKELLTAGHPTPAAEVRMAKALALMEHGHVDEAVGELRSFEACPPPLKSRAAVNLAFLATLEGDSASAATYAELAVAHDRYNARALVNMGNVHAGRGDVGRAREMYLEAIGVEANCAEAVFNLGLLARAGGSNGEAIQALEKLRTLAPGAPEVLYQLASLYDSGVGDGEAAAKCVALLLEHVPHDAGSHQLQGALAEAAGDDATALQAHTRSYHCSPVNVEVVTWLALWHVKHELYERAAALFLHAARLSTPWSTRSDHVKWRLMAASCYRRMGALTRAYTLYEEVLEADPRNAECLRYLILTGREIGKATDKYREVLLAIEQQQQQQQSQQQPGQFHTDSALSQRLANDMSSVSGASGQRPEQQREGTSHGGAPPLLSGSRQDVFQLPNQAGVATTTTARLGSDESSAQVEGRRTATTQEVDRPQAAEAPEVEDSLDDADITELLMA